MKETRPIYKTMSPRTKLNSQRASSEPSLFPPIDRRYNDSGALRTVTNSSDPDAEILYGIKRSRLPLPPRYMMYRRWGLVTNGGRAVYTVQEEGPKLELPKARTMDVISPRTKKIVNNVQVDDRRVELPGKRSAIVVTGHEVESRRSIRKKIEEFRNWHEDQYRQKINLLKARAAQDKGSKDKPSITVTHVSGIQRQRTMPVQQEAMHRTQFMDNTKRPKLKSPSQVAGTQLPRTGETEPPKQESKPEPPVAQEPEPLPRLTTNLCMINTQKLDLDTNLVDNDSKSDSTSRVESPPAPVPDNIKARICSAKTWKTWRDVNDSYAYNNVKEYIKENDLLENNKEKHINDWIVSLERAQAPGACPDSEKKIIQPVSSLTTTDSNSGCESLASDSSHSSEGSH